MRLDHLFLTPVVTVSGIGYFGANGLYQTDGTPAGTHQIYAGQTENTLAAVGGSLFFTGHDSNFHLSLFETNLTTASTTDVAVLNTSNLGGNTASSLQPLGTGVVFYADGNSGDSLWYSNGTAAGTVPLALRNSQAAETGPTLVVSGNEAYFISSDGVHGDELWKTDGTQAGTVMVDDVRPGSVGGLENESEAGGETTQDIFADGNGTIYFSGDDGIHGLELWQTDGTAARTSQIAQINQSTLGSDPGQGVYLNGKYIFRADDGIKGSQLWTSDGTAAGTTLLSDVAPAVLSNYQLTVIGTEAYFAASSTGGTEIWKTDGTTAGTTLVDTLSVSGAVYGFTGAGSKIFFSVQLSTAVAEYVTDGTAAGTMSLNVPGNGYVNPVKLGNELLFRSDASNGTHQLWISDGTVAGTTELASFANGTDLATLAVSNGVGYFAGSDSTHGTELWKTDGTTASTTLLNDINPGSTGSNPANMTVVGNTLYFTAYDGTAGNQIWKTDGAAAGTVRVTNIQVPSENGLNVNYMTAFGNQLLFEGNGLYVTNGTSSGTIELATTVLPGGSSDAGVSINYLAVSGSYAYFNQFGANGYELARTDGTVAGTSQIANINPNPVGTYPLGSSYPYGFVAGPAGQVLFSADDGTHGREPWLATTQAPVTVGSISGTVTGGLTGETIYLDANNNSVMDNGELNTTTSATGTYSFSNVPVGAYIVRQILTGGYTQTSPASGTGIAANVSAGLVLANQNFTDQAPVVVTGGTINGTVSGGLAGETIYLDANNNSVLNTGELNTITSATGSYSFSSVPAGAYIIRQLLTGGYTQTSPSLGYGIHITVSNGTSLTNQNFTDKSPVIGGSVSGTVTGGLAGGAVYLDANNNSKVDAGELSTITASNGTYSFSNVPAGAYIVRQVLAAGYAQTTPASGYGIHITVSNGGALVNQNFVDSYQKVYSKLTGTTIGTAGSYKNIGNTIAMATDGNLSTFFDGPTANGNWVGLDLGSSKTINQIMFAPRSGYASRMVGGVFQISTAADFSTGVTTLYTIAVAPTSGSLTTVTLSSPVTARYIRYLSPSNSYGDISEFDVLG